MGPGRGSHRTRPPHPARGPHGRYQDTRRRRDRRRRGTGHQGGPMTRLLQTAPVQATRIMAVGGTRGDQVVTNDDVAGPINSSDEWIRQRTGIATRVYASQSVLELAHGAAQDVLAKAGMSGAEIDAVVVGRASCRERGELARGAG